MIKKIRLMNWKSFEDATLNIDPVTLLIGANASGKSNALDAFLFLNRVSSGAGLFQSITGDLKMTPLRGGRDWVCRKPFDNFTLEVLLGSPQENQDYRYQLTVHVNATKAEVVEESLTRLTYVKKNGQSREDDLFHARNEGNSPSISVYYRTGDKGRSRRLDLNPSFSVLTQIESTKIRKDILEGAKLVQNDFMHIFVFDPIPSHMRAYTSLSDTFSPDGSNIAGVLAGLEEGRRNEVEIELSRYLKKIPERDIQRVWAETVNRFQTDAMLYCEEGWEGNPAHVVDARGMSDGTLRFLAIVTALLTRDPGSLLVIEEVDNGLHPSRAGILIEMLNQLGRERRVDVVLTTHNPALLDAAGVSMIPFITVAHRNGKTGASQLTLLEDVYQLPKLMSSGSIGSMSTDGLIEAALEDSDMEEESGRG